MQESKVKLVREACACLQEAATKLRFANKHELADTIAGHELKLLRDLANGKIKDE